MTKVFTALELEGLPAEKGWSKWREIKTASGLVERIADKPTRIWVYTPSGPICIKATKHEIWQFRQHKYEAKVFVVENGVLKPDTSEPIITVDNKDLPGTAFPCDDRSFTYRDEKSHYALYSDLSHIPFESRKDLCRHVTKLLNDKLREHKQVEWKLKDERRLFKK